MNRSDWKSIGDIYKSGYWINKEGDFVHVSKIDHRYAANIEKFLLRRGREKLNAATVSAYCADVRGEGAMMAIDQEIYYLENAADPMDYVRGHPFYPHLVSILYENKEEYE